MSYKTQLKTFGACNEGIEWTGERTLEQLWAECERIDWLLWLAGRLEIDRKKIVRVACGCARLALPYVAEGETRPLAAIELAERWAAGDESITIDMLREAANAADAAAYAAANVETKTKCLEIFREIITLEDFIVADRKIQEETK